MSSDEKEILKRVAAASIIALALLGCLTPSNADKLPAFIPLGEATAAPSGWIEFCVEYGAECKTKPSLPRDAVLSDQALNALEHVNRWVNTNITRMTDIDHWGLAERWNYPDDGYGDCEDKAFAKPPELLQR